MFLRIKRGVFAGRPPRLLSAVFAVFYFCISRQAQFPQPVHILDFSLVASLILFQCIIDFGFSPFIPVENSFCDFTLLCKKHKCPLVVTKCPTRS